MTTRLQLLTLVLLGLSLGVGSAEAATGGPDGFGYTWYDNTDGCRTGLPEFGDDRQIFPGASATVGPFDPGFAFPFHGRPKSQIWVSPRGYLTFSPQPNDPNPVEIVPGGGGPNDMIAAGWGAGITASDIVVEQEPGRFHVQWVAFTGGIIFTDIYLYPNGDFSIVWNTDRTVLSVGYRDDTGAQAHNLFHSDGVTIRKDGDFPNPAADGSACIDAPALLDCGSAQPIACGGVLASSLPGTDTTPADYYTCSGTPYDAVEQVFRLDVASPIRGSVYIDEPAYDLMLIDGVDCGEFNCLDLADPATDRFDFGVLSPGSYYFAVDGPAAAGSLPFDLSVECTASIPSLPCGALTAGDTTGLANTRTNWPGVGARLDGPEEMHLLSVPSQGPLSVLLTGGPLDRWVIIMTPDLSMVLAAGAGGASLPDVLPGSFAVIVEGENGAFGPYELDVACGAQLDCSLSLPASCSTTVVGDNTGGPTDVDLYTCSPDLLTGSEAIYRLVNPVRQTITARFLSNQPGQRLVLTAGCSEGACRLYGDAVISCALLPAGEYFLIVDGAAGTEGPFEIEINCSESVSGIDLAVTAIDASALVGSCENFDITGDVRVTVSNLGNAAAVAPFDVLLFEDDPSNTNGQWDPGADTELGRTTVLTDIPGGQTEYVIVAAVGTLQFRDNVVLAAVDPDGVLVGDTNPANDIWDTGRGCEFIPPVGMFEPVVEWWWQSSTVQPTYLEVDTIPLVGDVNADGHPDVVVVTGAAQFSDGFVRLLDGRDGSEIWNATAPALHVYSSSNLAMADLDGDPGLEIVGHSMVDLQRIVAIDDDGSLLWTSQPLINHPATGGGGGGGLAPAIADIDCDGVPEVIVGANVFDGASGGYFWMPEAGGAIGSNGGGSGALSVPADLDGDGVLEVVAGPTAYQYDALTGTGRILWQAPGVPDGTPAIGNFDDDDAPEVVITASGSVYLVEGDTGAVVWTQRIPAGGGGCTPMGVVGGPPTIADFDGDCKAEVGVAGADWYTVFETDGSLKWQAPINDCTSHRTASTVFDFDGDGAAEVAFMDERRLHIFQGRDGAEIAGLPAGSHTWIEMISIADVDGDNNAEIIMPLNPCFSGAGCNLTGVQVIGDANDNWVNTRRIWNQHAYHVTNVLDDGRIPGGMRPCEADSWIAHNTYRDQLLGRATFLAPDLTLSILETEVIFNPDCFRDVRILARVGNGGAINTGGDISASFYDVGPGGDVLLFNTTLPDLAPGAFSDFEITIPAPRFGQLTIRAVADDDGTGTGTGAVNECREDNNYCEVIVENDASGTVGDAPASVGWALRATGHGPSRDPMITAEFNWLGDEGIPRPVDDHYHVLRSTDPRDLRSVAPDPWTDLTWTDSTPRAVNVPQVHFFKVVAVDRCEQEELSVP